MTGAGNETKLGMSKGIAEPKLTAADAMLDKLTAAVFALQIVMVLALGAAGNIWKSFELDKVLENTFPCLCMKSRVFLYI